MFTILMLCSFNWLSGFLSTVGPVLAWHIPFWLYCTLLFSSAIMWQLYPSYNYILYCKLVPFDLPMHWDIIMLISQPSYISNTCNFVYMFISWLKDIFNAALSPEILCKTFQLSYICCYNAENV